MTGPTLAMDDGLKETADRAALDLMLQIPPDLAPREIWDLGCGTGEHAALLSRRHPHAAVHGLESCPANLAAARTRAVAVDWVLGDIADFSPRSAPDLIVIHAARSCAPPLETLLPGLVATLSPGGVFACRRPAPDDQPWRRTVAAIAAEAEWRRRGPISPDPLPAMGPEARHRRLAPLADVNIWTTAYLHVLESQDAFLAWLKGVALRPYLDRLAEPEARGAFLARCADAVRKDLPPEDDGTTLLPIAYDFIVARRR